MRRISKKSSGRSLKTKGGIRSGVMGRIHVKGYTARARAMR